MTVKISFRFLKWKWWIYALFQHWSIDMSRCHMCGLCFNILFAFECRLEVSLFDLNLCKFYRVFTLARAERSESEGSVERGSRHCVVGGFGSWNFVCFKKGNHTHNRHYEQYIVWQVCGYLLIYFESSVYASFLVLKRRYNWSRGSFVSLILAVWKMSYSICGVTWGLFG